MKNRNRNSDLAWKRNNFYGRISRYHVELNQLIDFPLTNQEKSRLVNAIIHLKNLKLDKKFSDELFGKQNNWKKYQNDKR